MHLSYREAEEGPSRESRADGSAAARPPDLSEKIVAALYALLRDRAPSAADAAATALPEIPGSGPEGLLDTRRRDVSIERRRFLDKAYAEHVTDTMLRALANRNDVFRRRIVPETLDPRFAALFDGDLDTRVALRAGDALSVDLKRAVEIRGIAFAAPLDSAGARPLAVTIDDGSALWALSALSSGLPLERYELDSAVKVSSLRLYLAGGPPREIAEIVLAAR